MNWYEQFLLHHKNKAVEMWIQGCEKEFANTDLSYLHRNSAVYMDLLMDLHIPVESHPSLEVVEQACRNYVENHTPIQYLLRSSHIWRESIMKCITSYFESTDVPVSHLVPIMPALHQRLDMIQRRIFDMYCTYSKSLLKQKDQTISQLHDDRLSMLGKMAASMAHEIRNPLTAIEGFIHLIRSELKADEFRKDKVKDYLDIMQNEFTGLYGHITAFLSFSKNDGTEEPFIVCSIKDMIESVLELVNPRLINENIVIQLAMEGEFSMTVQKVAMRQVLSNLLSNSIDALSTVTDPKVIRIQVREDDSYHYIDVIDNGIGIPEGIQDSIFTPFISGKNNGTGLGLAVCKQIMEKNNGKITFVSKEGDTRFTLAWGK